MGRPRQDPVTSELWQCPECGHRFVTANIWHSCTSYTLDHHFADCEPAVRQTFDEIVRRIQRNGPVTIIPQKTRIAFQVLVRFASVQVRKRWLLVNLWLTRKVPHARLTRTESYGARSYGHQFKLLAPSDCDDAFQVLVDEAYRVGERQHLSARRQSP